MSIISIAIYTLTFRCFVAKYNNIQAANQPHFVCWGNYGYKVLMDDCGKHDVSYPFYTDDHINLKTEAKHAFGFCKGKRLARTFKALNMTFEGRSHAGVHDVYNIARLAIEMVNRGKEPTALCQSS